MKQKLTLLLFSLLLAVGWTNDALAQLRPEYEAAQAIDEVDEGRDVGITPKKGQRPITMRAPLRTDGYTSTAPATHVRSWYENSDFDYTWYDANKQPHRAKLTDKADNTYQMYYLTAAIYKNPDIPGIRFSDALWDIPYYTYGYQFKDKGYNNIPTGTYYSDLCVKLTGTDALVQQVQVINAATSTTLATWSGGNLPNDWSSTSPLQSRTVDNETWYYMENGGRISIPHSITDGNDSIKIRVTARALTDDDGVRLITTAGSYWSLSSTARNYISRTHVGGVEPPHENGYTVLLVSLKDTDFSNVPEQTTDSVSLINYYNTYIKSMELLTDGMRVEEGTEQAGTVFAYRGVLDKFFFVSKGKMFFRRTDRAPFYSMYEEFSPDEAGAGEEAQDLYANMRAGEYYDIRHDCQSVIYLNHFFAMVGKDTIAPKGVDPLIFYIPDQRGAEELERSYDIRPQVGLYQIDLSAEAMPSVTQDSTYTVYLEWSSTLNNMTSSEVDQTYIIYTVTYDSIGNRIYTPLDTVYDETTYQYDIPQTLASQTIHYVIKGFPTDATNNPVNDEEGIFYTYSNLDDVQIPGWFDFMVLYRERYESDFVIHEEKNYYRNYVYPTNIADNTGMTLRQIKTEWPNQTASYTLWRDNTGIAVLEVRAIGKKVYYRIRYYDDTQVKTGPNNIEMDYQTIND